MPLRHPCLVTSGVLRLQGSGTWGGGGGGGSAEVRVPTDSQDIIIDLAGQGVSLYKTCRRPAQTIAGGGGGGVETHAPT